MGKYLENGQMKWLPLTLYGNSFLRFVLEHYGYVLDEGIVLVADDEMQVRQIVSEYIQNFKNGRDVQGWKRRRQHLENYQCAFLKLERRHTEPEVLDFLAEKDFLPVVICGGILPEYLRSAHYVFRVGKEDLAAIKSPEFAEDIGCFQNYILSHIPEICNNIGELESSIALEEYEDEEELKGIFSVFIGAARIYAMYLRQTDSERGSVYFLEKYDAELKWRLAQMTEFASGSEIPEMLSELVWDYIEIHPEIQIVDEDYIDGSGWKHIETGMAIVFDKKYYLFPPRLFMAICKPLLQNMSEPELKKVLKGEGILYCNTADYTVKKTLTNVFGAKERVRFLWIGKEFLLSSDNLYLEDVAEKEGFESEIYWKD